MKICMFTNTYLPHVGGVARSVQFFTEDLRRMGHEVLVVAPTFPDVETLHEDENEVLRVPAIQNFNGSDFSVRIPIPFVIDEKITEFKPDIIHSHHPYLLGDAGLRAARRRLLPLIFTHHTLYEKYTHYVSQESEGMKRFVIHLSTEYANLCDRVVAPSESVAELIHRRGMNRPTEVIPTGVDTRFFGTGKGQAFRQEYSIPQNARVIGHLGRLAPEKNLDYLVEAVIEYVDSDPDAYFLVVGRGLSEEMIHSRFAERGLKDRLVMGGEMTGQKLADAYHAMNLFVFASKSETQGMVLTEAMAAGIPVIALDASGAREVVQDGENGRLLSGDASAEDFAGAVRDAFDDPDRMDRWREKSLQTAKAFSRASSAEKMVRLYTAAIQEAAEVYQTVAEEFESLEEIISGIKAEWDLLSEKARAVVNAVQKDGEIAGVKEL